MTYRSLLATANLEARVVTPPTRTQSESNLEEEHRRRRNLRTEGHYEKGQSTRYTFLEADMQGKNRERGQPPKNQ